MKSELLSVLVAIVALQCTAQEVPPVDAFQALAQGDGSVYREAVWKHCVWGEFPGRAVSGLNWQVALDILYAQDEIPGLSSIPSEDSGIHTGLHLDTVSIFWRRYVSLAESPLTAGSKTSFLPEKTVDVQIFVFPDTEKAHHRLRIWYAARGASQVNEAKGAKGKNGFSSGNLLGEACVFVSQTSHDASVAFVEGRTLVVVEQQGHVEAPPEWTEAIAWGLLYRVLHHKVLHGKSSVGIDMDGRANLNGVLVAPLSRFREAGCILESQHPTLSWVRRVRVPLARQPGPYDVSGSACTDWRVRVIWGQRWVELRALDWEMKTWEGKTVKLSRPAFPYKGDLVAPIEEVRKALGLSVQAQ
jgi:hypothetical protein